MLPGATNWLPWAARLLPLQPAKGDNRRRMTKYYASIVRAERKRYRLTGAAMLLPIFTAVPAATVNPDIWSIVTGFSLGCVLAYVACRLIYARVKVNCPRCAGQLNADYAESPKHSSKNVEHNCTQCARQYVDGTLLKAGVQEKYHDN